MPGTVTDSVVNALGDSAAEYDPEQVSEGLTLFIYLTPPRPYYDETGFGFTPTEIEVDQATGEFSIELPANASLEPPTSAYRIQILRHGTVVLETDPFVVPEGSVSNIGTLVELTGGETALATKTTFDDEDYVASATDRYIAQIGTMTGDRTVTLPPASSVPAGAEITIADESGTSTTVSATNVHEIIIEGDGTDVVHNSLFPVATNDRITSGFDSRKLRSNNVDGWVVTEHGTRRPYLWYSRNRDLAVPSGVWVPLPWEVVYADNTGDFPDALIAVSTTVAAGSNGATLPQGTINVASTAAFEASGWLEIVGPPGSGVGTVVKYGGKGATTFTLCNTAPWAGISTGTLATGQTVRQAYVGIENTASYLWFSVFGASFAPNATGYRTCRFAADFFGSVASFADGPEVAGRSDVNGGDQHVQATMQPAAGPNTAPQYMQVYQTSGGVLNCTVDGLTTPILMAAFLGGF